MSETPTTPRFQQAQLAFAAHIRDPQRKPAPADVEDRRMQIYRELFYNTVEGFLANAFPVIRRLSTDVIWHARVRDFYARHTCRSPLFHGLSAEFVTFLQTERGEHADDPPFLAELAHYEWVELALGLSEAELTRERGDADTVSCTSQAVQVATHRPAPAPNAHGSDIGSRVDPNGDLLTAPPLISPLAWPLAYAFPVHRITPEFQPTQPPEQPSYLVVYRTRQDEVRFMEINAVTARLLQLIEEHPAASGQDLLLRIATELGHPQPGQIVAAGRDMLRTLRERDILLGTRHA